MPVTIIKNDNMFNLDMDIRVNPVNCVGVMGKGLALEFAQRYGSILLAPYKHWCLTGKLHIGTIHPVKTHHCTIINFPTKNHWKDKSTLYIIEASCKALREYLDTFTNLPLSVAIPPVGCGLGGLLETDVLSIIHKYFDTSMHSIYYFAK